MTSGLWARRASRLLHPAIIYFIICNYWKSNSNGQRWIRTTEAICSRFTVCPLWPLGNLPIYTQYEIMWKADDRTRTDNLLITNQLLCQLSHIGIFNCQMTPTGFEPVLPPWKGDVLTAWPWGQVFKSSSPSRARTYNPSVNSRVLYHWAIEEYHLVNHGVFVNVNTFDLKMQVFFIFF